MSGAGDTVQIRSFRVVFQLERRLHRIDRWRIPVPYGVPLRGVAYAVAALGCVVMLTRLPVTGEVLGLLPPPFRLVVVPVGLAYLLTRLRVDGRPAHAAAVSAVRAATTPTVVAGFRPGARPGTADSLGTLVAVPDERFARYRRGVVEGPTRLVLRYPVRGRARGRRLELIQSARRPMLRGKRLALRGGQRVHLR